jgi:hypothetical protein
VSALVPLTYACSIGATSLAWPMARRRPEHRPVAWLLTFGLVSDLIRRGLQGLVLGPAYVALAGAPATGWVRVAAHVEQALFLAWPAGLAALTLWTYLRWRPWPVVLGYATTIAVLIIGYPGLRGALVRKAYLGFELACVALAVGAFVHWIAFRRGCTPC